MKAFFALSCLVAVAYARPGVPLNAPLAWTGATSYAAGTPLSSQFHAQDELGQYSYGYAGGPSSKTEAKTADGITRGSFSYVDAHGLLQSRSYVSDPVNGFRVAASDLPVGPAPVAAAPVAVAAPVVAAAPVLAAAPVIAAVPNPVADTVEVAAAKAQHYAAHAEARARNGDDILLAAAPVAVAAAPVAVAAPAVAAAPVGVAGLQSQYHAQDELGQYSYGYAGGLSAKDEHKTADGITRGSYSYVDAHGLLQSRSYVSDPINGFRVAASDLPVGPAPVAAAPVAIAAPAVAAVAAAPVLAAAPVAAPVAVAPAPIATPVAAPVAVAPAGIVSDDTVVVGGVADTPEVVAARAAHFAAHQEAKARLAYAY